MMLFVWAALCKQWENMETTMIYSLSYVVDILMSSAQRIAKPWMLWRLHAFPENSRQLI